MKKCDLREFIYFLVGGKGFGWVSGFGFSEFRLNLFLDVLQSDFRATAVYGIYHVSSDVFLKATVIQFAGNIGER